MTVSEAKVLVAYTRWANLHALESAAQVSSAQLDEPLGGSFGSLRGTLAHMLGAEWVWLERFHGRSPRTFPGGDDLRSVDDLRRRWAVVADGLEAFVGSLEDEGLQRQVAYTSFRGDAFVMPLDGLLRHVVNHSTYHRGQVALLLRLLGATPRSTDFAAYLREAAAR